MPLETEVKFLYVDHDRLRARLLQAGAVAEGRWLERNLVLDDAEGRLFAAGSLLRLRRAAGRNILTFKRPPESGCAEGFKVCREYESAVDDFEQTRLIFEGLGYRTALVYEKFREVWRCRGCSVCLDLLPFGPFLEIEGDESSIADCAGLLGLSLADASSKNYHELNQEDRASRGLPPDRDFAFSPEEKDRLSALESLAQGGVAAAPGEASE